MYELDLEKTEEPEIKLSTFVGSWRESKGIPEKKKKIYFCFSDYT